MASMAEIEQSKAEETKPQRIPRCWRIYEDDDEDMDLGDESDVAYDTDDESEFEVGDDDDDDDVDHEFLAEYSKQLKATNVFDVDVYPKDGKFPPIGCIIPMRDLHNQKTTLNFISYLSDLAINPYSCTHTGKYSFKEVVKANTRVVAKCEYYRTFKAEDAIIEDYKCKYYITFKAEDAIEGCKTFQAVVLHGQGEFKVISCTHISANQSRGSCSKIFSETR